MTSCDAHDALWKTPQEVPHGKGYLLSASFMQRSAVQEKAIDRNMAAGRLSGMTGMTREQCRRQLGEMQGRSRG